MEFPQQKTESRFSIFPMEKVPIRKYTCLYAIPTHKKTIHAQNQAEEPNCLLNFIDLSTFYILYVTLFLTVRISDKICVTVCMQNKFEPTFRQKKIHGSLVVSCVCGISGTRI